MKKFYAITMLAFLFAGAGAFAENPLAVDGIEAMPAMEEEAKAVICESLAWMDTEANTPDINKAHQFDPTQVSTGKDDTKPSIMF